MIDFLVAEQAYILLLTVAYVALVRGSERLGFTLLLLSLLPPTIIAAKYYAFFASAVYQYFQGNLPARIALTCFIFFLLLALFHKFGLCEESVAGCVAMALGAAAVGSILIFFHLSAGGLALGFALLHYVTAAMVYTLARRSREKLGYRSRVQSYMVELRRACGESNAAKALSALDRLHASLEGLRQARGVRDHVGAAAEHLRYLMERSDRDAVCRFLRKLSQEVEAWEAQLSRS